MANGIDKNGHEYVDLGLPSGTKWAKCNIGASEPDERGDYFAWGEIETKSYLYQSNYKYEIDLDEKMKYWTGSVHGRDELVLADDVAHELWGADWRIPSEEQIEELIENTEQEFMTVNCIKGVLFKASNGNYIFLPYTGLQDGGHLEFKDSRGYYWSRTLNKENPNKAHELYFSAPEVFVTNTDRYYGCTIRPVRP